MAKRNRFYLKKYYPDIPLGWGLYHDKEIEEKTEWMPFLEATMHYQEAFQNGNEEAIFEFVKLCPKVFREVWAFSDGTTHPCYYNNNYFLKEHGRSWVIEQIEKWKAEDTPEARKKLKKLFRAYVDSRGAEEKPPEKDWKIYEQIKKQIIKKTGIISPSNITKAIWKVVGLNDKTEKELDTKLQKRLLEISPKMAKDQLNEKLIPIAKETGIPQRKLRTYITWGKTIFNTYREIYYKLSKLEKKYIEEMEIIEKNLRYEYFLPCKGVTIPEKYVKQFNEELSLFGSVEWLRRGCISFPQIRSGVSVYSGMRPFEEKRLSLKEALEEVSKEKNIPLDKLKEIYTNLKHIQVAYFGPECLDALKDCRF